VKTRRDPVIGEVITEKTGQIQEYSTFRIQVNLLTLKKIKCKTLHSDDFHSYMIYKFVKQVYSSHSISKGFNDLMLSLCPGFVLTKTRTV